MVIARWRHTKGRGRPWIPGPILWSSRTKPSSPICTLINTPMSQLNLSQLHFEHDQLPSHVVAMTYRSDVLCPITIFHALDIHFPTYPAPPRLNIDGVLFVCMSISQLDIQLTKPI